MGAQPGIDGPTGHGLVRLQNLRDVGGLQTVGGAKVRPGVLYRSDAPHEGDERPSNLSWPPRTVVDLRSSEEVVTDHPLRGPGIAVTFLPLAREASLRRMMAGSSGRDELEVLYASTLRSSGGVVAQVAAVVARSPGPVLVHCAAGKDRTGVAVATLLAAVGVAPEEIVADYLLTQRNMPGVLSRLALDPASERATQDLRRVLEERPWVADVSLPAIRGVLEVLDARPGGPGSWLLDQGLDRRDLRALRESLVG